MCCIKIHTSSFTVVHKIIYKIGVFCVKSVDRPVQLLRLIDGLCYAFIAVL